MKRIHLDQSWPDSWKYSYPFDLEEIYGEIRNRGYAYAYANRRQKTLELITDVLSPPARIIDIAAAQGNFSLALAEAGYRVTWNDLRADLADYVRLKHERGDITYAPGNAFELNFSEPFDAVLMTEIVEHVAHPDEFLRQASKLVRGGGYIVMTTPNGGYFRNQLPKFSECADPSQFEAQQFHPDSEGHIFLLHSDELHTLGRQAGLEIERLELFTNPLTNGHMKMERLLHVLPRRVVNGAEALTQTLPFPFKEKVLLQLGVRFRKLPEIDPEL